MANGGERRYRFEVARGRGSSRFKAPKEQHLSRCAANEECLSQVLNLKKEYEPATGGTSMERTTIFTAHRPPEDLDFDPYPYLFIFI